MRFLADLCYLLAALVYLPVALYNAIVVGKNRHGWKERFGFIPSFPPASTRIWIHAVSLGEINATPRLVQAITRRWPDCDVVVSSSTDTGFARAVHHYGRARVIRAPLDFSFIMGRVLRRIRPSLIVLVEQELWFNQIRMARARGIPVAVVNGRMTQRSAGRYALLGPIARSIFSRLSWVGAQDEAIAGRFRTLGTPETAVSVVPSLKWDTAPVDDAIEGDGKLRSAMGIDPNTPLWVCGSTGPGEEAMILQAYADWPTGSTRPQLVLVPRKPERFNEVAALIERHGFTCIRRTNHADGGQPPPSSNRPVYLGDTMGELRKFYVLADVVFVGRSLVPMGGSDPMEVAALGKPLIMGPHTSNFVMPVTALQRDNVMEIGNTADEVAQLVRKLLDDLGQARCAGERARQVVLNHQGGTDRTTDALIGLLQNRSGS
ncbi:MAG: 3-deoxy-D-manno-octulosonic acid transferase [Planctomycetota bacterium]|jgi:3-deoxy-D-manno-octulosonic-acid transferase